MKPDDPQGELFGLMWRPFQHPFRLRVNDLIRVGDRLALVNVLHPTQKPVAVMQALIEAFSKPNDVVLDPFAGSGTTGIAARNCGRQFILIEKVWLCFKDARNRLDRDK